MSPEYDDAFKALKLIIDCVKNQDARRKQEACLISFDILLMVNPENEPPQNIIKLFEAMLQKSKEGVKHDPRFHTYIDKFEKLISKTSKQENIRPQENIRLKRERLKKERLKRELKRLKISR